MKTILVIVTTILFGAFGPSVQDKITVKATYDGYYDGTYSFTTVTEDEDDFGDTLEFEEVSSEILKAFDLKSKTFVDKEFIITYKEEIELEDDEEITTYTLLSIVKTKKD